MANWKAVPHQVTGLSFNAGIGLGYAILHKSSSKEVTENKDPCSHCFLFEMERLEKAFKELTHTFQVSLKPTSNPSQDIIATHVLLSQDPGWRRQLEERIHEGRTALEAVDDVLASMHATLKKNMRDKAEKASFWKERILEFEDLSNRLKGHLGTFRHADFRGHQSQDKNSPFILVANQMVPAELLDYDRSRLAGLILGEQSQNSHVSIVARSLDIPVVGGIKGMMAEIRPGDLLLVDGNEGCIYVRPQKEMIHELNSLSMITKTLLPPSQTKPGTVLPTQTLDGVSISLQLNASLVEDVDYIEATGAEGVGLYRTEIPFMMHPKLPNVIEQTELYKEILRRARNHPVIFRTLDVAGDKMLPYLDRIKTESPLLEKRTSRILFDRPVLLRYQLRALIRAGEGKDLNIMLPMVAEVREVEGVRKLIATELAREKALGSKLPRKVRLGAMLEVPALAYQLPLLLSHIDFLSVGSNDLFQFFYAIDRDYPKLSMRYDVLSSAFLALLNSIRSHCEKAQIPVSVCGEMAGHPLEALALIGLGYKTLSMSAAAISSIKHMVRSLNYQQVRDHMTSACSSSQTNIRQCLQEFAQDQGLL